MKTLLLPFASQNVRRGSRGHMKGCHTHRVPRGRKSCTGSRLNCFRFRKALTSTLTSSAGRTPRVSFLILGFGRQEPAIRSSSPMATRHMTRLSPRGSVLLRDGSVPQPANKCACIKYRIQYSTVHTRVYLLNLLVPPSRTL